MDGDNSFVAVAFFESISISIFILVLAWNEHLYFARRVDSSVFVENTNCKNVLS